MQWTKRGVHPLLQTRVKTLNQELRSVFQRWYADLQLNEESWRPDPQLFDALGILTGILTGILRQLRIELDGVAEYST